ncbi:unnamed protein product [Mytilus edulis]|uniref:Secreted protein n=1 Tax=Mytilus edulis TaxID=6550 RepID=A0A8S3UMH3_MYTED|nr:unnamed protein product [Mytilus edulis]
MYLLFVTIVLAIVLLGVHNHECKNYNLSASDQSLIDMMKHYLHTSRREECPTQSKTSNTGLVLKDKPVGIINHIKEVALIIYVSQNDPENGQHQSYNNDQVYGGEYEISSTSKPSGVVRKYWQQGSFMRSVLSRTEISCTYDTRQECRTIDNKNGDENGALFYPIRTKCGSLRCPPYTNEADVLCVVCTKSNV